MAKGKGMDWTSEEYGKNQRAMSARQADLMEQFDREYKAEQAKKKAAKKAAAKKPATKKK